MKNRSFHGTDCFRERDWKHQRVLVRLFLWPFREQIVSWSTTRIRYSFRYSTERPFHYPSFCTNDVQLLAEGGASFVHSVTRGFGTRNLQEIDTSRRSHRKINEFVNETSLPTTLYNSNYSQLTVRRLTVNYENRKTPSIHIITLRR